MSLRCSLSRSSVSMISRMYRARARIASSFGRVTNHSWYAAHFSLSLSLFVTFLHVQLPRLFDRPRCCFRSPALLLPLTCYFSFLSLQVRARSADEKAGWIEDLRGTLERTRQRGGVGPAAAVAVVAATLTSSTPPRSPMTRASSGSLSAMAAAPLPAAPAAPLSPTNGPRAAPAAPPPAAAQPPRPALAMPVRRDYTQLAMERGMGGPGARRPSAGTDGGAGGAGGAPLVARPPLQPKPPSGPPRPASPGGGSSGGGGADGSRPGSAAVGGGKAVKQWSVADVVAWLQSVECEEHAAAFRDNKVCRSLSFFVRSRSHSNARALLLSRTDLWEMFQFWFHG